MDLIQYNHNHHLYKLINMMEMSTETDWVLCYLADCYQFQLKP